MIGSLALLLAQTPPPIVSGDVAGWSSFGITGLVLAWLLLQHLPAKDKQIKEMQEGKDRQILGLITAHNEQMAALSTAKDHQIDQQRAEFVLTMNTMMTGFRAEATAERQACEKHFGDLSNSMTQAFKVLGDQLSNQARQSAEHSRRNQEWIDLLKKEIEERKAALARGDK